MAEQRLVVERLLLTNTPFANRPMYAYHLVDAGVDTSASRAFQDWSKSYSSHVSAYDNAMLHQLIARGIQNLSPGFGHVLVKYLENNPYKEIELSCTVIGRDVKVSTLAYYDTICMDAEAHDYTLTQDHFIIRPGPRMSPHMHDGKIKPFNMTITTDGEVYQEKTISVIKLIFSSSLFAKRVYYTFVEQGGKSPMTGVSVKGSKRKGPGHSIVEEIDQLRSLGLCPIDGAFMESLKLSIESNPDKEMLVSSTIIKRNIKKDPTEYYNIARRDASHFNYPSFWTYLPEDVKSSYLWTQPFPKEFTNEGRMNTQLVRHEE